MYIRDFVSKNRVGENKLAIVKSYVRLNKFINVLFLCHPVCIIMRVGSRKRELYILKSFFFGMNFLMPCGFCNDGGSFFTSF